MANTFDTASVYVSPSVVATIDTSDTGYTVDTSAFYVSASVVTDMNLRHFPNTMTSDTSITWNTPMIGRYDKVYTFRILVFIVISI